MKKNKSDNIDFTNNKRKKKKIWPKVLITILIILVILVGLFIYKIQKNGGGLSGMLATMVGHDENTKKDLEEIQVLLSIS